MKQLFQLNRIASFVFFCFFSGYSISHAASITSTFDLDADDWMILEVTNTGGAIVDTFPPAWQATGGNPGGHIIAFETGGSTAARFSAPGKFIGDKRTFIGSELRFDLLSSPGAEKAMVQFLVNLLNDTTQEALTFGGALGPSNTFTTYVIPIEASAGWTYYDLSGSITQRPAVSADFDSVLSNLSQLSIQGEFINGPELTRLDNVVLGPISELPAQVVKPEPPIRYAGANQLISFDVIYSTVSLSDPTLAGLGLRIHWDSSQITFNELLDVFETGLVQQGDPEEDIENFDDDRNTDRFVRVAWLDSGGAWPGSEPQKLYTINFTTKSTFSGSTTINFSADSTAVGRVLDATSAIVNFNDCSLDIDGNGRYDALSDGLLTIRYLFGFKGDTLCEGAISSNATRNCPEIEAYLQKLTPQ